METIHALPLPQPLATFVLLLAGGALAQLVSAWLRLPSIVFLLFAGIALGPEGFRWIQPEGLEPFRPAAIQVLVAVILFEGSLSLRFREIKEHGRMVRRLLTVGAFLTFTSAILLSRHLAGLEWREALLFGSLVVVTGPTVIMPLLKRLGLQERVHSILKWEGILIDPLGAILAVLCLELALSREPDFLHTLMGFGSRLAVGALVGLCAGILVGWLFERRFLLGHAVGDLGGILGLSAALLAFGFSETLLPESGLVTVTVFGVWLGGTKFPYKHEIVMFKEQVTTVAISLAFVWLSARVRLEDLRAVLPGGAILTAALLFVVRPLSVWVSAWGLDLGAREKAFLSLTAPRGIVAASFAFFVADAFAAQGTGLGTTLVPLLFLVITASVLFAGLLGNPLAAWLKVKEAKPLGLLIAGANAFARMVARQLQGRVGLVKLVDPDPEECRLASNEGSFVYHGDPTDQRFLEKLDLKGIGKLLATWGKRESNILSCQIGARLMGSARVFRLDARRPDARPREVGSESWGLPLSHLPWTSEELVQGAADGRLKTRWKPQPDLLYHAPKEGPGDGFYPFLSVHKGEVLFMGEKRPPFGAEILELHLEPSS